MKFTAPIVAVLALSIGATEAQLRGGVVESRQLQSTASSPTTSTMTTTMSTSTMTTTKSSKSSKASSDEDEDGDDRRGRRGLEDTTDTATTSTKSSKSSKASEDDGEERESTTTKSSKSSKSSDEDEDDDDRRGRGLEDDTDTATTSTKSSKSSKASEDEDEEHEERESTAKSSKSSKASSDDDEDDDDRRGRGLEDFEDAAEDQEATNNNLRASNGHRELGVDGTSGKTSCLYAYYKWECDSRWLGVCTKGAYRHQHKGDDYFYYCVERKGSHNDEFRQSIGEGEAKATNIVSGGDYLEFTSTGSCSTSRVCNTRSYDGNKCDNKGDGTSDWDVYQCTVN